MSTAIAEIPAQRYHRDYSQEFKAEVLAALKSNDGNQLKTAKEYGIDESLVRLWLKQEDRYRSLSEAKAIELATKYEANLHRTADAMMDQDLDEVSYVQKATAIGILTEKMLLLRGQPTSITATVAVDSLSELQQSVQQVAQAQAISIHDACLKLAHELEDVPELAQQLRTWAEAELAKKPE